MFTVAPDIVRSFSNAMTPSETKTQRLLDATLYAIETVGKLSEDLVTARQQLDQANRHIIELNRDLTVARSQLVETEKQIIHLQQSTSWKLTAPLRALVTLLRKGHNPEPPSQNISPLPASDTTQLITSDHPAVNHAQMAVTRPSETIKQWLVDISELVRKDERTGGIPRVVRSILNEWRHSTPDGFRLELIYATPESQGYRYARQFSAANIFNNKQPQVDEPIHYRAGDVFIGLALSHHVTIGQRTALSNMRRHGVAVWFIAYDLLPVTLPACFPSNFEELHKDWLKTICQFDGIVCISQSVKVQLSRWLEDNPDVERNQNLVITWFHLGADLASSLPSTGLPAEAPRTLATLRLRPSFLMVGTLEPRKGYAQALAAFEILWKEGVEANLVIVGKAGWLMDTLIERMRTHPQLRQRLFWLEAVSDEYLEAVYAACSCLLAASYDEGFGLPLIEAAQHKLPILARNVPVFKEVAGEHASYFEASEPEELAQAIKHWLTQLHHDAHVRSDHMTWLTWRASAQSLTAAIDNPQTHNT